MLPLTEILTTARRLGFTGERNSPGRIDRAQIGCTLAVPFVRLSHKPDEPMLNPDQIFGQLRPILTLAGSILIAGGLLKFFGVNVPIHGSGLEIAVAGYLMKSI